MYLYRVHEHLARISTVELRLWQSYFFEGFSRLEKTCNTRIDPVIDLFFLFFLKFDLGTNRFINFRKTG